MRDMKHPAAISLEASGRYQVGEAIATGGMGTVHRAFDAKAQRPVAYKRLRDTEGATRARVVSLFQREYDTLTQLTHPNIVEVYDFGFDGDGPYYTMELLSGDDLSRCAPLSFRRGCQVIRDVASALALVHARRMVHRDVSPNNVRLTSEGRAKLIDFGALTPFGAPSEIVGTPAFIAPECLSEAPLDQRTDLYSLGALAYWTLTRRLHAHAFSIDELHRAWREPIAPPSQYASDVPQALDELVLSLLDHEPSARPTSAADVIEQLTSIADLAPEQDEQRVAFSYLKHPPLVGREQIVDALSTALESANEGSGQIVLLEGEQGSGRSALLDQTAVRAQLLGATVLRAEGRLHTAPFSAARALVRAGLLSFPELVNLLRDVSSPLLRLVETDDETQMRSTIDVSERSTVTSGALEQALLRLSERSTVVLLVDDSHEIDGESAALLASMVESMRHRPILLVLSSHVGHAAREPQICARLEVHATRLRVSPLSEQQLSLLVTTLFGAVPNANGMARWLTKQTGGNPSHAMDLARLLLRRGAIRYTVGTFTLPFDYEETYTRETRRQGLLALLVGVTEDARRLADLLGVHASALTAEQLEMASGLSAREVLLALEELVQCGVAFARAARFSCTSNALSAAIREQLADEQRRALHIALARAFAASRLDSIENRLATAQHLLSAGAAEELEGAYLLARTGDERRVELGMNRNAVPLMERGLTVLQRNGFSDEECTWLLVPLALSGFYGDIEAQRRYLDRALEALSSLCGITLTRRLTRFLGARAALFVALVTVVFAHMFTRRKLNRRPLSQHFEALGGVTSSAAGAAACAWDIEVVYRMASFLDPLAAAPVRSGLFFMRQYALATAELLQGRVAASVARFRHILEICERRVFGVDEHHREQMICGCLNTQAQGLVSESAPETLTLAAELEQRSAFFAPHAEVVRMTYYAFRGEADKAAVHRARSEALALQGASSWSAFSVLAIRTVSAFVFTGDAVGLVRALADLERLASLSPGLSAFYELSQAHLEQLRGHPERALPVYERVLASPVGRALPTYPLERAMHVQALSAAGDHAAAKALCLQLIAWLERSPHDAALFLRLPVQKLALAEAGLGNIAAATELLEGCLAKRICYDNPLLLGMLHRDRAHVAALAGDAEAFEHHLAAMEAQFRPTENPSLMQQCVGLRAEGVRRGVLAPLAAASDASELDGETVVEGSQRRETPRFDDAS